MTKRQALATAYFREGYNCAQSVYLAFAADLGIEKEQAIKAAAAFGGGMGRLQRTCGALTGAYMVLGSQIDQPYLELGEKKEELTKQIQEITRQFEQEFGSSQCRELIGVDLTTEEGREEADRGNLSETHCRHYILRTVTLLETRVPEKS